MQPESSQCEEETPSLLWGLDPVFLAFAKLYIGDILDLKESRQVPGMWLVGLEDGPVLRGLLILLSPKLREAG